MHEDRSRVLVLGATGYVGGRLVPELIQSGFDVRCMTRTPQGLSGTAWARDVEVVDGDLSDLSSIGPAFDGVDQVVYLVHSLGVGDDFMQQERVILSTSAGSATTVTTCRRTFDPDTTSGWNLRPVRFRSRSCVPPSSSVPDRLRSRCCAASSRCCQRCWHRDG